MYDGRAAVRHFGPSRPLLPPDTMDPGHRALKFGILAALLSVLASVCDSLLSGSDEGKR